jgi:DNA-directed RNA polymerase specialized sigma24 family protein
MDLGKLIALREANYSLGKIAIITGLPKSTVHSTLKTAFATIS